MLIADVAAGAAVVGDDFSAAIPTNGEIESVESRAPVRQSVRRDRAIYRSDAPVHDLVSAAVARGQNPNVATMTVMLSRPPPSSASCTSRWQTSVACAPLASV